MELLQGRMDSSEKLIVAAPTCISAWKPPVCAIGKSSVWRCSGTEAIIDTWCRLQVLGIAMTLDPGHGALRRVLCYSYSYYSDSRAPPTRDTH